jgi:hypothetical protein
MSHLPTYEPDEEYTNPFIVENAKSGRSTCGACKSIIAKGGLRVGATVTTADSSQHGRTFWKHLGCVNAGTIATMAVRLVSVENAEGWASLSKDDKALVRRVFEKDAAALAQAKEAQRAEGKAAEAEARAAAAKKSAAEERKAAKEAEAAAGGGGEKTAKKAKK